MDPIYLIIGTIVATIGVIMGIRRLLGRSRTHEKVRRDWGRVRHQQDRLDHSAQTEAWLEAPHRGRDSWTVDTQTWTDLDLDRVITAVDRTHTGLGRQMLYRRVRSGDDWLNTPAMETLANRFTQAVPLRERIGFELSSAGRRLGRGFWIITRPSLIQKRWWYWLFPLLAVGTLASLVVTPFEARAFLVAVALAVLNLGVRTATSWQLPGVLTPMRQLAPLLGTAGRVSALLETEADSGAVRTDLSRLRSLMRVARWVSRDPTTAGEATASFWEYVNTFFLLDANALLYCAIRQHEVAPRLARIAAWLGDVDVALSVASLRAESREWRIPDRATAGCVRGVGIWHPLVAEPVANDAELCGGAGMVVSGANMSGKSTYLRTIGVAALLSRTLNTCPATQWSGPLFRVRSLMGHRDDLQAGKSYYQVEVDGVVALLRDSESAVPTLFLLDELLRGTNTTERLAAGEAVLRALLSGHETSPCHVVVVATHDRELVEMLQGLYSPWHFRETVEATGRLTFDYKRQVGPATTRTAIALLKASGAPSTVVEAARNRVEDLNSTPGRWAH